VLLAVLEGDDMGMQSFRSCCCRPAAHWLPEHFDSYAIPPPSDALVRNGLIEDTTKIWWDIRPLSHAETRSNAARISTMRVSRRAESRGGAHAVPAAAREQILGGDTRAC
jgi:hypothetical protein